MESTLFLFIKIKTAIILACWTGIMADFACFIFHSRKTYVLHQSSSGLSKIRSILFFMTSKATSLRPLLRTISATLRVGST